MIKKLILLNLFLVLTLFLKTFSPILNPLIKARELSFMKLWEHKNPVILFLGLDERNDSLEVSKTTDTIMLIKLNLLKNNLSFVSLPRDLWYEKNKSKINQIYPQTLKNQKPLSSMKDEFSQITGQNIDHIVILNTQVFKEISDIIGPVEVDLPYSFTDDRYPNPEYIKNPKPTTPVYQTISFTSGKNIIDSKNVLPFIRSRKGSDNPALGGTDLGRIGRQQILINAYIQKLISTRDIDTFFKLLDIYQKQITQDLPLQDIFLYSFSFENIKKITFRFLTLPFGKSTGVFYDPQILTENQAALLPTTPDFKDLKNYLEQNL